MHRSIPTMLIAILAPFLGTGSAQAQQTTPITIGESLSVPSEIMGEQRPIVVGLPAGYESGGGRYPVIYLLDGPGHIAHATGSVRYLARNGRALPAIIVGVANTDRTRDLTPTNNSEAELQRMPTAGGAEKFRSFLVEELRPFIDEHYRTNGANILIGHSFGGLFAIDAAIEDPESFDGYIAISPSLWWSDERFVEAADAMRTDHALFSRSLYVAMGDEGDRMNGPFERFIEGIERNAPSDFELGIGRFPDEDHGSIPLRATIDGLEAFFAPVRGAMNLADVSDVSSLEGRFAALSDRFGFDILPPEQAVNQLGYRLLQAGQGESARAIFAWNVSTYAGSANVHDSLGECLENLGETEKALASYERAAEIGGRVGDPNLGVYQANAERLRGEAKSGG